MALGRWDDLESLLTKLDNENSRRSCGVHSYDGTPTTLSLDHVIGSSRKRIRSTAGGGILSSQITPAKL